MNLNLTVATRYGLNVLALLGIALALYLGSSILIPLTISVLLATILFPAAKWLHHRLRLPWFFACLSTIFLLLVLSLAVISAIGNAVTTLVTRLPSSTNTWRDKYNESVTNLRKDLPFVKEMLPTTSEKEDAFYNVQKFFSVESLNPYLYRFAGYSLTMISELVLVLFVVLFLLLEAELLAKKVRAIFGTTSENQQRVVDALAEMAEAIRTYLVWRTIINLGLAIVLGVFYGYFLQLENWYLWAVLTAVLSYVPYIGTIAAGVPPVLEALLFKNNPGQVALVILVFYTILVTVEGYLVVPWVMGRSMDLNATTVMLACLFWNLVWGVSGLFLAMPLMAAIKAVMLHVDGWKEWGELLSSVETTPAAPADPAPLPAAPAVRAEDTTVVMDAPPTRTSPTDPV
jgi:AI-2 transport protein TqsA